MHYPIRNRCLHARVIKHGTFVIISQLKDQVNRNKTIYLEGHGKTNFEKISVRFLSQNQCFLC